MKVALIKQALDVFGPWASVRWKDTDPKRLFEKWPGKAVLWEMTCLLEADWYVIENTIETDYHRDLLKKHPRFFQMIKEYVRDVYNPKEIPFEEYDVIITLDPILSKKNTSNALMAYFINEHTDRLYNKSVRNPIGHYDLFLAHMMDAEENTNNLPKSVSFPYMRAPDIMRKIFRARKRETVWADWRTLAALSGTELWSYETERAAKRLQDVVGLPVSYYGDFNEKPFGLFDPPKWGDAAYYLDKLSRCKYYIGVGRGTGSGQGLSEAASLGCMCIGERNRVVHRLICHSECLCEDLIEMPARFRRLASSAALQGEVLGWQEERLRKYFIEKPLTELRRALDMKRSAHADKVKSGWARWTKYINLRSDS